MMNPMNFQAFQADSMEMGEIMRALEEIEGTWQDGESLGFVEDGDSEFFGSWHYVGANDRTSDEISVIMTDQLGYDELDKEDGVCIFFRMNTIVQVKLEPREAHFYIDHSYDDEYDLGFDDEDA